MLWTTKLDWPRGLSIAMTDSIPLVALPLKLFAGVLPPRFSAIELWLVLAYMAQPVAAVFALRSAGERRLVPAVAVAAIAISMPAFLLRQGHSALSSHFLILLAIGSYFRMVTAGAGRRWLPPALQLVSFLIHPYLSFMVAGMLAAAPVSLLCRRDRRWRGAACVVAGGLALTAATTALLGYGAEAPSGGFGVYSMNVMSPTHPKFSEFFAVPDTIWGRSPWAWEGYQYLGVGMFVIIAGAAVTLGLSGLWRLLRRHVGLVAACLVLSALAVSNVVRVGDWFVVDFGPVPSFLNQLRISGRLFWPVAYLLLIGSVALIMGRARSVVLAACILLLGAVLQVAETHGMRVAVDANFRRRNTEPIDPARLADLVAHHAHVTVLPTEGCGLEPHAPAFLQIALAASGQGATLNTM